MATIPLFFDAAAKSDIKVLSLSDSIKTSDIFTSTFSVGAVRQPLSILDKYAGEMPTKLANFRSESFCLIRFSLINIPNEFSVPTPPKIIT